MTAQEGILLAEEAEENGEATTNGFDPETDPESCDPAIRETFLDDIACGVDTGFGPVSSWFGSVIFWGPEVNEQSLMIVVIWSILAAIGFTIYFKAIQFTGFKVALEVVRGKYSRNEDPGEVSHFQALTSALSATVGLGNIGGVAAAVTLGGPGAAFWMVLFGLLGMCTKFVECTLGVKYRYIDEDGVVHGGPFQYLKHAFKKLGKVPTAIITGIFAIALILFGVGGGGMYQTNQTMTQAREVSNTYFEGTGLADFLNSTAGAFVIGIIFAGLVGLVIIGGIKSIGKVTATLVPAMAIVYVVGALIVVIANIDQVPSAFGEIITGAFGHDAVAGGILGIIFLGAQRAAFSNEAGIGSAPIAHAAVKTRRPASEGFVAALEPFIDTVVICTMTALVIIVASPNYVVGEAGGVEVTSAGFATVMSWFPAVLMVAVALFAFSSIVTWSYYGTQAWRYLFGKSPVKDTIFRAIVLIFVVMGCLTSFGSILEFADAALFLCIFINVVGLVILAPKVKAEVNQYLADRKAGRLMEDPEPLEDEKALNR